MCQIEIPINKALHCLACILRAVCLSINLYKYLRPDIFLFFVNFAHGQLLSADFYDSVLLSGDFNHEHI